MQTGLAGRRCLAGAARVSTGRPRGVAKAASRVAPTLDPVDICATSLSAPHAEVSAHVQRVLEQVFRTYAVRTPTVGRVVQQLVLQPHPSAPVVHDHYAFRTFGVPGLGMRHLGSLLEGIDYRKMQSPFKFEKKKLLATWYAPMPLTPGLKGAHGEPHFAALEAGLPRIFVSEVQVELLSPRAQEIIHKYTAHLQHHREEPQPKPASFMPRSAAAVAARVTDEEHLADGAQRLHEALLGPLPWCVPSREEYNELAAESEYAAWVLAHGYSLNHTALSLHRMLPPASEGGGSGSSVAARGRVIGAFTEAVVRAGIPVNKEGGLVKVSPDALLLQSSTMSDAVNYTFAPSPSSISSTTASSTTSTTSTGGAASLAAPIPGAYIEFVERRPLAQHQQAEESGQPLEEWQRRDGFEVGNADAIFMSTFMNAATARS